MKLIIRYWRLEYSKDGSNKFYEVWVNETESELWLAWGRIGTEGQSQKSLYPSAEDAKAKGLAQVYAKQSKGYSLAHDDLVFEIEDDCWPLIYRLRGLTKSAISSGEATPREAALNYIEGFVVDCNEFLSRAKEGWENGGYADFEMERAHEDLNARWEELKDKFDSAETMMQMVNMRALRRA